MNKIKKVLSTILCFIFIIVPFSTIFVSAEEYNIIVGDANGDNKVTAVDALLVLQQSISKGLYTLDPGKAQFGIYYHPEWLPYDTDNDGWINANDALLVLQYSVDKINSFPRESAEPYITPIFNTPSEVVLYKNGNEYKITNTHDIEKIISVLNFWFPLKTQLYLTLDSDDNFIYIINEIKTNQTSIELRYVTKTAAEDSRFSCYSRLLIPTTGEFKNNVFFGDNESYFSASTFANFQTDTRLISIVDALSVE